MPRYNSVAISLHWLIAFFLVALLAMGKYMTGLEETDSLRYSLTQWHKSIGIVVLLLVLARIVWRLTHEPPALPGSTNLFERVAGHAAHFGLYVLMVIIPVSGWVMVSLSPLKLKTELFGIIPWPHITFLNNVANVEVLAERSVDLHTWLANSMIALVLLHIAAALFHQFIKKDQLISRMTISAEHKKNNDIRHGLVMGFCLAAAGGLFLFDLSSQQTPMRAGFTQAGAIEPNDDADAPGQLQQSLVGFTAMQLGDPVIGEFQQADVQLYLYVDRLDESTLTATVTTKSVKSSDSQIDATVVTSDWFASDEYPEATFSSTGFTKVQELTYLVAGDLMIKGVVKSIEFEVSLNNDIAEGEFEINRSDFGVGDQGQDEFVAKEVTIRFGVENSAN